MQPQAWINLIRMKLSEINLKEKEKKAVIFFKDTIMFLLTRQKSNKVTSEQP